jgi:hypothetical protein
MRRRDDTYWQRLRNDRRSNAAAIGAAIAALAATMTVISVTVQGGVTESRANPLYWLLMLPMVWWVNGLTSFEPRAVRLWKPALAIASGTSSIAALLAIRAAGTWTGQTVACTVTLIAAAASLILLRGSLVECEGPAR